MGKEKPECRGPFAAKTVEAAEVLLQSHVKACSVALVDSGNKVEELRVAAAQAELVAKAAQSELEAAQTSMITEDNLWVEAEDAVTSIKVAIKSFDQKDQDLMSTRGETRVAAEVSRA